VVVHAASNGADRSAARRSSGQRHPACRQVLAIAPFPIVFGSFPFSLLATVPFSRYLFRHFLEWVFFLARTLGLHFAGRRVEGLPPLCSLSNASLQNVRCSLACVRDEDVVAIMRLHASRLMPTPAEAD